MGDNIRELNVLLEEGNIQACKTALTGIEQRSATEQKQVIELLALAKESHALDLMAFLLDQTPGEHPFHNRLFQLAVDRAHINYLFAPVLLDHADPGQYSQIIPLLKHILSKETRGKRLNQIIRSVGKLKLADLVDDLAEFIFYDEPDLKREAVKALERIGTASALERLEQVAGTKKCDTDILDAVDVLRSNLTAPRHPNPSPLHHPARFPPQASLPRISQNGRPPMNTFPARATRWPGSSMKTWTLRTRTC